MKILACVQARLTTAHAGHCAIARGMLWVGVFVLLASLARATREMAIAYRYGAGAEVDAYLFVFTLLNWPVAVWLSVVTVVLVPLATRIQRQAPADLPRFRSELLGMALLLGCGLALLASLALPWLLDSAWSGLAPATLSHARSIALPLALLVLLGILIGVLAAWTMAGGRHFNTLLEGVPALVLVAVLLAVPGGGIEPLVWGTLAGFALHVAALAAPLAYRGEFERPRFGIGSPHWPAFRHAIGIVLAAQALMSITTVADQFFAAHLGVGAIAKLGYASRIVTLILGIGALAANRSMLPVFSRAQAASSEARRLAAAWITFMFVLGVLAIALCWWLAPWIVELVYERGAFTGADSREVTSLFRLGLVQVPFYFSALVVTAYLSGRGRYVWLFLTSALGLATKLLGNALLVPVYGLEGIMMATAGMYAVNCVFLWFAFRALR